MSTNDQGNATSLRFTGSVAADVDVTQHLKPKRSQDKARGDDQIQQQLLINVRALGPTPVTSLISSDDEQHAQASNETVLGKRTEASIDERRELNDCYKRRKISKSPDESVEVIDLTAADTEASDSGHARLQELEELFPHSSDGNDTGMTQFEITRRYFTEKGTAGVSEEGLAKDVVRALRLVRRLEKQATETPEEAMRRMKTKSRRLIQNAVSKSSTSSAPKKKRKAWIVPNRLDTHFHETQGDPDHDKWSDGDEAATQDVQKQPEGPQPPKRKRRIPWLEQNGWDTDKMMQLLGGAQAAMIDAAKEGLEKKSWEKYKEENPNWQEDEAKRDLELKKQRKERRQAAKLKAVEMKNAQAVVKKGQVRVVTEPSQDGNEDQDSSAIGKTADEVESVHGAEDASELEGEFDINDWASDDDDDGGGGGEYEYEDDEDDA